MVVAAPISVLCKILRCLEGLLGGIGVLCRTLKGLKGLVGGIGVLCKILRCLEGLFWGHWRFVQNPEGSGGAVLGALAFCAKS